MPLIWHGIEKQTIDYGVMEHAENVVVIPADMDWLDVGTWTSLKSLLPMDGKGIVLGRGFVDRFRKHPDYWQQPDHYRHRTKNLIIVDTPTR